MLQGTNTEIRNGVTFSVAQEPGEVDVLEKIRLEIYVAGND